MIKIDPWQSQNPGPPLCQNLSSIWPDFHSGNFEFWLLNFEFTFYGSDFYQNLHFCKEHTVAINQLRNFFKEQFFLLF